MSRDTWLVLLAVAVIVAGWVLLGRHADVPPPAPAPAPAANDDPADIPEPDAAPGETPVSGAAPAAGGCAGCLAARCEAVDAACAALPACVALDGCLFECPPSDDACGQACVRKHGAGVPGLDALSTCARTQCAGPCYAGFPTGIVSTVPAPEPAAAPPQRELPPPPGPAAEAPPAPAPAAPASPGLAATPPVPPCASCLQAKCPAQDRACAQNRACTALNDCLSKCVRGDPGCAQECSRKEPTGIRDLQALMDCAQQGCRDACWADGGPQHLPDVAMAGTLAPPEPDEEPPTDAAVPTCDSCLRDSCGPQGALCGATPACVALDACLRGCGPADPMCLAGCQLRAPAGIPAFRLLATCGWAACTGPCYGGEGAWRPDLAASLSWGGPGAQLAALRVLAVAADIAWWSRQDPNRWARRDRKPCGWACRHGW